MRGSLVPFFLAVVTCSSGASAAPCALPAELPVRAIVRLSAGALRRCYSEGLRRAPALEGRVTATFVVQRDGSVGPTSDGGSDIGDPAVVACVLGVFGKMRFPPLTDAAFVEVRYPLLFTRYGGGLRTADVTAAIRGRQGRVRLCYERASPSVRAAYGEVELRISVDSDGLASADAVSSGADASLEACVASALDGIALPRPTEPTAFSYRVALAP